MKIHPYLIIGGVIAAGAYWYMKKKDREARSANASPAKNPATSAASQGKTQLDKTVVNLSNLAKNIGGVITTYRGGSPKPTTISDLNTVPASKTA